MLAAEGESVCATCRLLSRTGDACPAKSRATRWLGEHDTDHAAAESYAAHQEEFLSDHYCPAPGCWDDRRSEELSQAALAALPDTDAVLAPQRVKG